MLMKILALIGAALLIWLLYRTVSSNPATFSKVNMSQSFRTMGLLALGLIGFVTLCIFLLRI